MKQCITIYLTATEKEALKEAINHYSGSVADTDADSEFAKYYHEHHEKPLSTAYNKLIGKHNK